MEIFFPHDKFLHRKFPPHNPLPSTLPPTKKILLKASVHFPITITMYNYWSKFVNCNPLPGDCGEVIRPQRYIIRFFNDFEQNGYLKIFYPVTLGKKWAWERA